MSPISEVTKTVSATEAQTNFLEILDDVADHHVEVLVTRAGEPVAMVVPLDRWRGPMEGTVKILGDIVAPLDEEWEANR